MYELTPYRQNQTIGDLMLRIGEAQAQGHMRKGDIIGNTVGSLGSIASGYIQDRAAAKAEAAKFAAEAPLRADADEKRRLELDALRRAKKEKDDADALKGKRSAAAALPHRQQALDMLQGDPEGQANLTKTFEAIDGYKNGLFGEIAYNLKKNNFSPEALTIAAQEMESQGFDPAKIKAIASDPNMLKTQADAWIQASPRHLEQENKDRQFGLTQKEKEAAAANLARDDARAQELLNETKRHNTATEQLTRSGQEQKTGSLQDTTGGDSIFVGQPGYKKLTPAGKTAVTSMNNFIMDAQKYRKVLDKLTGKSGVNLTGEDAAELDSAHAALLFTAAKAFEQGALQAPDKAVVEQMIPNPAKWSSILKTLSQGGKAGQLRAMDTALENFKDRMKSTWGLSPTGEGSLEDGTQVPGPSSTGPKLGEQRMFDGKIGVWDGKGWKAK